MRIHALPGAPTIPDLWHSFMPREGEIDGINGGYGICRGLADSRNGEFEYTAALGASDTSPVPEGMLEMTIPAGTYLVTECHGLKDMGAAWGRAMAATAEGSAHPAYYGEGGWEAGTIPAFEYYPPDKNPDEGLYILIPVKG